MDYGGVDGVTYLDWEHYVGLWNTTVAILTSLGWTTGTSYNTIHEMKVLTWFHCV